MQKRLILCISTSELQICDSFLPFFAFSSQDLGKQHIVLSPCPEMSKSEIWLELPGLSWVQM